MAERAAIAELVAEGDRILFADPAYRFELGARWRAGVPAVDAGVEALLPVPDLFPGLGSFYVSAFDLGELQAKRDFRLAAQAPVLLVVSDGETLDRFRRNAPMLSRKLDLSSTIALLNKEHYNNSLYVSLLEADPEAMVADKPKKKGKGGGGGGGMPDYGGDDMDM